MRRFKNHTDELLKYFQQATVFTPSMLKQIFETLKPVSYLRSLAQFQTTDTESKGFGFVQGTVQNQERIKATLLKRDDLVMSLLRTFGLFSNNDNYKLLSVKERSADSFNIQDYNNPE